MSVDELVRDALAILDLDLTPPSDGERVVVERRARQLRRRAAIVRASAAALATCLVLIAGGLLVVRSTVSVTDTGTTTPPPTSEGAATAGGDDVWVLVPRRAAGHELSDARIAWYGARSPSDEGDPSATEPEPTRRSNGQRLLPGVLNASTMQGSPSRSLTVAYGGTLWPPRLGEDPALRISTTSNTGLDLDIVRRLSHGPPIEARDGAGGVRSIDIGDVCAADGQRQLMGAGLNAMTPCRRLAYGVVADQFVVVDAVPGTDLGPVLDELRVGTWNQLEPTLRDLPHFDEIRAAATAPPPTAPPSTTTTMPDTPLCRAWAKVQEASRSSSISDPGLLAAMDDMAAVAPPELAQDLGLLAQQWQEPGGPPPDSADTMARVTNAASAQCGGSGPIPPGQPGG